MKFSPARNVAVVLVSAAVFLGAAVAHGQPSTTRTYRLGVLLYSTPTADPNMSVFREAMRAAGYVEGRNLVVELRYAEGRPERLRGLAEELVQLRPDVIVAFGGDVVPFAQAVTRSIPIVGIMRLDAVRASIVPSLAHPGGNFSGFKSPPS